MLGWFLSMSDMQDVTEPIPVQPVSGSKHRVSDRALIVGAVVLAVLVVAVAAAVQFAWKQYKTGELAKSLAGQSTVTATAAPETSQSETAPAAVPWVPVDKPKSLVIRRDTDVVLSVDRIGEMAAVDTIVPPGFDPVWLNNEGTGVGTDMKTAWITGHNIVGSTSDPFGLLGDVRPGDLVEISHSGGTVSAVVNPGMGDQPSDGVWIVPKSVNDGYIVFTDDPGIVKLVSCTDDGGSNIVVTATLVK